ncbi:type II toxin-antitoxin system PemK/MazF family toxin [Dyadobacter frigoris]|uniref:mRNA interferase n=1 Tax=Dyadobacter frigoris TaxID=2576211 RepID=A0A4U6D3R7_9BACT|nr:type II toxin-antitoxin system PemK/MazF family toxin [Dyadobacter frigoris]TKT91286.1 type II toxin-antitoxin system PemK/MazF family toxin [Dyadobacter frigoris]GLU56292.1 mRNA interferase PemK [Dyadobacter frigoris]
MKQKDIWWADLNPVKGSEQQGRRPVVIISGNTMNDHLDVGIACPLSSKIKNFAGCVIVKKGKKSGLDQDSEIITFQVRTISKSRLVNKIGQITEDELRQVKIGLNEILTY